MYSVNTANSFAFLDSGFDSTAKKNKKKKKKAAPIQTPAAAQDNAPAVHDVEVESEETARVEKGIEVEREREEVNEEQVAAAGDNEEAGADNADSASTTAAKKKKKKKKKAASSAGVGDAEHTAAPGPVHTQDEKYDLDAATPESIANQQPSATAPELADGFDLQRAQKKKAKRTVKEQETTTSTTSRPPAPSAQNYDASHSDLDSQLLQLGYSALDISEARAELSRTYGSDIPPDELLVMVQIKQMARLDRNLQQKITTATAAASAAPSAPAAPTKPTKAAKSTPAAPASAAAAAPAPESVSSTASAASPQPSASPSLPQATSTDATASLLTLATKSSFESYASQFDPFSRDAAAYLDALASKLDVSARSPLDASGHHTDLSLRVFVESSALEILLHTLLITCYTAGKQAQKAVETQVVRLLTHCLIGPANYSNWLLDQLKLLGAKLDGAKSRSEYIGKIVEIVSNHKRIHSVQSDMNVLVKELDSERMGSSAQRSVPASVAQTRGEEELAKLNVKAAEFYGTSNELRSLWTKNAVSLLSLQSSSTRLSKLVSVVSKSPQHSLQLAFHNLEKSIQATIQSAQSSLDNTQTHRADMSRHRASMDSSQRSELDVLRAKEKQFVERETELLKRKQALLAELEQINNSLAIVAQAREQNQQQVKSVSATYSNSLAEMEKLLTESSNTLSALSKDRSAADHIHSLIVSVYERASEHVKSGIKKLALASNMTLTTYLSNLYDHVCASAAVYEFLSQRISFLQSKVADAQNERAQLIALGVSVADHANLETQLHQTLKQDTRVSQYIVSQMQSVFERTRVVIQQLAATAPPQHVFSLYAATYKQIQDKNTPFNLAMLQAIYQTLEQQAQKQQLLLQQQQQQQQQAGEAAATNATASPVAPAAAATPAAVAPNAGADADAKNGAASTRRGRREREPASEFDLTAAASSSAASSTQAAAATSSVAPAAAKPADTVSAAPSTAAPAAATQQKAAPRPTTSVWGSQRLAQPAASAPTNGHPQVADKPAAAASLPAASSSVVSPTSPAPIATAAPATASKEHKNTGLRPPLKKKPPVAQ